MGILDRVSTLIRANVNDLLDRAEDPEKVLRQLLLDLDNGLIQVKTQVGAAMADEHRLRRRWEENDAGAAQWHRKAEVAVNRGDDDLARQALARHNSYAELAAGFRKHHGEQVQQVVELRDLLHQLELKIQSVQAKKELIVARSRRVKAEMAARETLSGLRDTSALAQFGRIEDRVEEQELRVASLRELDRDSVEARFEERDRREQLDAQLAELKLAAGQDPAGRSERQECAAGA